MLDINQLKWKTSDEIAKIVHKWQLYSNLDYYEWHIRLVCEKWLEIAEKLWLTDDQLNTVKIICNLHDAPEDTWLNGEFIEQLFWNWIWEEVEALNKKHSNWIYKTKDEYYTIISQNILRKITKTADRYINVSSIPNVDKHQALKYLSKYQNEQIYFEKYKIFPEILNPCFEEVNNILKQRWRL